MAGSTAANGDAGPSRARATRSQAKETVEDITSNNEGHDDDDEPVEVTIVEGKTPSVRLVNIKMGNWNTDDYLDLSKGNYMTWSTLR